ncbi:MarR family winged helix-turn-helix transcriptional regulator [Alloalcanivorax xenomutans]|uniref:MarR family winged helix-turn-helix transcriptional regulator n=1 Tax=Alloalcanivorax xenomutans TaxID=1094342 RepID=UPI001F15F045|nr:MarR family transcriptional regulator [Alloalcanivorax xenomutans]MCE7525102.1 MarR family transcriptional regulator [Alloalcanivorax xenomutans]
MRELIQAMKAASHVIDQLFAEAVEPLGITAVQAEVLLNLKERGLLTTTEVGAQVQVHRANLTRVVDKLVSQGWVERKLNRQDGRSTHLLLTPKGQEQARRIELLQKPVLNWGIATVGDQEVRRITKALQRLTAGLG